MKKVIIVSILFLLWTNVSYSQSFFKPLKRFWYGLFGPVYHSDTDLKVNMIYKGKTISTLLPNNVDYYVVYKENNQFFIKIINPIYIDIKGDSIINKISVKEYLEKENFECIKKKRQEYKRLEKELESGKILSSKIDSSFINFSEKPKIKISKKEYVELNCKSYDTVNFEKTKTLFYIEAPKPYEIIFRQGITTGTLFLPIKIRPSITVGDKKYQRDFSTDVSVGPYIGYKYQIGQRYEQFVSAGLFAGPSLIRINSDNSNTTNSNESNLLGFTWGLGMTFEINKFQIGIVGGFDYLSGSNSTDWIYDKKFWISLGVGFKFFEEKK